MTNICCRFASYVLLNDALFKERMLFEEHRVSVHLFELREGVTRVPHYFQTGKINHKKAKHTHGYKNHLQLHPMILHSLIHFPCLNSASLYLIKASSPASQHQVTTSCDSLGGLDSNFSCSTKTCIVISVLNNESLNKFRVLLRKPLNFPLRHEGAIQLLFLMRTTDMQSHPSSVSAPAVRKKKKKMHWLQFIKVVKVEKREAVH